MHRREECEYSPISNHKNKTYMNSLGEDYCLLFGKTMELRENKDKELEEISKKEYEQMFIEGFKERILREAEYLKEKLYKKHDDDIVQKLKCLSEEHKILEDMEKDYVNINPVATKQATLKT